jgi:hypothetical protein
MSKRAFNKIAVGLSDAIAIARGEADPSTYVLHVPAEVDVKKIRRNQRPTPSVNPKNPKRVITPA